VCIIIAPSISTNEMVCSASLTHGENSVDLIVVVDGGFTEELTLQPRDVIALKLGSPNDFADMQLADGSVARYNKYATVTLRVTFTDGSF